MSGPGRHALALGRRGWSVDAIDMDASLLGRLSRAADDLGVAVRTIKANVDTDSLQGSYEMVLCLGTSFGINAGRADAFRLIERMRDIMAPAALLCTEIFCAEARYAGVTQLDKVRAWPAGGSVSKRLVWDARAEVEHVLATITGAGRRDRACYRQFVPRRDTMSALLRDAGLSEVRRYAGQDGWPTGDAALWTARAPD
nr:class I SAM-dependent methyltransferase [Kineosporia babensis]